jgi:hypothetical protein
VDSIIGHLVGLWNFGFLALAPGATPRADPPSTTRSRSAPYELPTPTDGMHTKKTAKLLARPAR